MTLQVDVPTAKSPTQPTQMKQALQLASAATRFRLSDFENLASPPAVRSNYATMIDEIDSRQLEALTLELAIPEAELCERLRAAVADAALRDAASMRRLRAAVASFTVALRDIGTTPERVLIALKTVINDRSFIAIAPHVSDWNGDTLRERVSTWCIEAFFRKDTP